VVLENAEGNVAILCPLGPRHERNPGISVDEVYETVTKLGIGASKYHSGTAVPGKLERYVVTTFKSAKGMEFSTVIIPRINFFTRIPAEWYVACTRARGNLIIYRDIANPQCDPIRSFETDTYESDSVDKTKFNAKITPF
jgi:superfamily I DNA/RNA helicase